MLSVRSVAKTFAARTGAVHALQGVDLEVERGSFTAIVGASGCGKTTLLRIIAGFERPDAGEVLLDGELVAGGRHRLPEHRGVGIVPQEGALFPHLSVARNIAFGLASRPRGAAAPRLTARQRRDRVAELLELIGLPGCGDRQPAELSGGQQQRVALARALAPEPRLVLLDEPFAALDAGLRSDLREEVRDVLARVGATTVLVTHDQEEALSLADRVAVMRGGRMVRVGGPREVYNSPGDEETASFLGDVVVLPGRLVAGLAPGATSAPTAGEMHAECALGCLAVSLGHYSSRCGPGECMVMLRPEQIRLAETGHAARVTSVSYFGHDALVQVRLGADGLGAALQLRTLGHLLPEVGDTVGVEVVGATTAYPSPTFAS